LQHALVVGQRAALRLALVAVHIGQKAAVAIDDVGREAQEELEALVRELLRSDVLRDLRLEEGLRLLGQRCMIGGATRAELRREMRAQRRVEQESAVLLREGVGEKALPAPLLC
jgi:hypothetical protein